MSISQTANTHSEGFQPPFAMIAAPDGDEQVVYPPLGIRYRRAERAVLLNPGQGEELLARFSVVCQAVGAMNAKGEPPSVGGGGGGYSAVQIAHGVGELAVTDARLVILLTRGESLVGRVDMARGTILAITMRLADIESVSVSHATGIFRRKEKRATIERLSYGAAIAIEQGVETTGGRLTSSPTGTCGRIANVIVEAAARGRLATPRLSTEERDILERAMRGERVESNGETIARLAV